MGATTVSFRKCVFNSATAEIDNSGVGSRVIFDLDVDGEIYEDVSVKIRELPESETSAGILEISELHGYEGPLNYEVLRGSIEFYFRQVMGGQKFIMKTQKNFLQFTNWTIEQEMVVQFEMPEEERNKNADYEDVPKCRKQ